MGWSYNWMDDVNCNAGVLVVSGIMKLNSSLIVLDIRIPLLCWLIAVQKSTEYFQKIPGYIQQNSNLP